MSESRPQITIASGLSEVDRAEWDALIGSDDSPFLEWDWLASLEEAGCVHPKTGWVPQHLLLRDDGRLVGAAPLYLKGHSQGEFVFDHGWADAAHKAGLNYYPKVLVAVPFTPATGSRLLVRPDLPRAPLLGLLCDSLRGLCLGNELSSVHVNFCEGDAIDALRQAGFVQRQGVQYQWYNRGYATFAEYENDLRSKRRNQIRRERREVAAAGVEVTVHEGEDITDDLFEPMFRIYRSTVDKMYWGRPYLNRRFFDLLRQRFKRNLCFIVARREGRIVAGTVNVQKGGIFYGRYWGALEEIRNLHFEVCYYAAIEHCIARGFTRFEPGAGGEFKYWRGFSPTPTRSMHFVANPAFARAVADFVARERSHLDDVIDEMRARGPLKAESGRRRA